MIVVRDCRPIDKLASQRLRVPMLALFTGMTFGEIANSW
jgi:hypothetical protein